VPLRVTKNVSDNRCYVMALRVTGPGTCAGHSVPDGVVVAKNRQPSCSIPRTKVQYFFLARLRMAPKFYGGPCSGANPKPGGGAAGKGGSSTPKHATHPITHLPGPKHLALRLLLPKAENPTKNNPCAPLQKQVKGVHMSWLGFLRHGRRRVQMGPSVWWVFRCSCVVCRVVRFLVRWSVWLVLAVVAVFSGWFLLGLVWWWR